jgi:hypothetical protein
MLVIFAIVWILAAVLIGIFGFDYMGAAGRTGSAIHQTLGLLGLGLAVLFVGQAIIMLALGGIRARQIGSSASAEDAANLQLIGTIPSPVRAAVFMLQRLADAGERRGERHSRAMVGFVETTLGAGALTERQRLAILRWLHDLKADEKMSVALDEIARLPDEQKREFARLAQEMVKGGSRRGAEAQQRLLDEIWPVLERTA